jgi:hypothetical protein
MNSKSTFWLMVAALGLGAYIFLFERHTLNTEEAAQQAAKLFPDFDPAKVASVEILRSNNVKFIRAERADGQWRLVQPAYPAQSTAIDNWLSLFGSLDRLHYLSAQDLLAQQGGLAAFGLDSPQATVMIQQGTRKIHVLLGAKTPVGEQLYLQQVGSDGAFVTDSALLDRLPQSATDWRDPTFLDFSALKFDRLHVRAGQRDFAVEHSPGGLLWRLTKPRLARADNALLQHLFQQLQTARVNQFISDAPATDLEAYGLQSPEVTLVFSQGTNSLLTIDFGKSPANQPGQVFARRSNHPAIIVTVSKHLLNLLHAPYTDFLDKHLIEFPVAAVERIEARAAEAFALQKQINGAWRIVEPYSAPADPALVHGFLDRLNALSVVEVAKEVVTDSDLPNYGFFPAARQYTLKSAGTSGDTNLLLAQIEFGTNQTDKVYVRRIDENSVYVTRLNESPSSPPLPTAAFELRDRRIWNFSTNQIAGLTIEFKGKTYKFQRNSRGQLALAPGSQGILKPLALEEALFRLGQLSSMAWVACGKIDPAQFGFSDPPHKLSIQLNSGDKPQNLTVEFGAQSLSGGPYALVDVDGRPTVFDFPYETFHVYNEVVRSLTNAVGAAR